MVEHVFVRVRQTLVIWFLICGALVLESAALAAQGNVSDTQQDLRARIERRYEVLPLRDGVLLKLKDAQPPRTIELSDNRIAINGIDVTGPELRAQLGSDADLVLQLSYLDSSAQRALFGFDSPSGASARREVSPPPGDDTARRRNRRSGALVRFGGDVTVGPDEVVTDDVVVFGGTAHIDGEVDGDVVAIGGSVELGPRAHVRREVTVVGGALRRDPGAIIDGDVNEVGMGPGAIFDRSRFGRGVFGRFWPIRPVVRLAGTSLRVAVLMLLASVLILLARKPIEQIGERAVAEPLKAGVIGLLAELLFFPTLIALVVLLAVTIIGIPLLVLIPFALLGLVIVLLMGFTAVTYRLGERVAAHFGWPARGPHLWTIVGIVIVLAPILLARIVGLAGGGLALAAIPLVVIGFLLEYLAWTVGFGAAVLARFRPASPPIATAQPAV